LDFVRVMEGLLWETMHLELKRVFENTSICRLCQEIKYVIAVTER
jgi:hypothetical protein